MADSEQYRSQRACPKLRGNGKEEANLMLQLLHEAVGYSEMSANHSVLSSGAFDGSRGLGARLRVPQRDQNECCHRKPESCQTDGAERDTG